MTRAMVTALLTAVPLLACSGSDPNPVLPGGVPKAPEARRPVNSPPTVSLDYNGGASGCHPRPLINGIAPCLVEVRAVATDPDGDPLTFSWTGCARGTGPQSACVVDAPGTMQAVVEVSDGRGGIAKGSLPIHGVNGAPFAVFLPLQAPPRVGQAVEIYGNVKDPDDGFVCGRSWCVRAEASGACGPQAFLECTCLAGLEAEVRATAAGTCTVTFTLKDDWGLEGQTVLRFDVTP
ncbi:MAG TPA: hypothetical protein VF310_03535 [Vicinamibacteria bacterium]